MMSCVELNVGWLQTRIRANFGFLFSFVGRTLFILLCVGGTPLAALRACGREHRGGRARGSDALYGFACN